MTEFDPLRRVRESFARQPAMETINARLGHVEKGSVEIVLGVTPAVLQQHGYVHGGIVSALADSACGFSALSLMEPDTAVLTAELKINFLAPADGQTLVARGKVVKPGRTLTVTTAEVEAVKGDKRKLVAIMTATMACVRGREIAD
jgi:uncharacterized protein (TIGR00369 family)